MVDLTELIMEAAKKGIKVYIDFESHDRIYVQYRRGSLSLCSMISTFAIAQMKNQTYFFDRILEEVTEKMEEKEEQV